MKKILKELVGMEVHVLLAGADLWYDLILVTIDEEEQLAYFTDITEDEEDEESIFWELVIRCDAILAIGRKTGKVTHNIEEYLATIKGDETDGTDEGE